MNTDSTVGNFRVPLEIGNLQDSRSHHLEALVDTGATYTWIPGESLEGLGIQAQGTRPFVLADGREVSYRVGWVRVRIGDITQPTIVVFGDAESEPLLGVVTLEEFGLGVDPVNRRLVPVPGLLKAAS